jgi:hypothetical protein
MQEVKEQEKEGLDNIRRNAGRTTWVKKRRIEEKPLSDRCWEYSNWLSINM